MVLVMVRQEAGTQEWFPKAIKREFEKTLGSQGIWFETGLVTA
jgi:hypothetical protein